MKWMRFRVRTNEESEDIIVSYLEDIGLEGAQIEDKIPLTPLEKEQMFVDILPETEADDGIAYLNFFVEDEKWHKMSERYYQYLNSIDEDENLVFLELGVGFNTPTIIMLKEDKEHIKDHYLDDGFKDYILLDNLENELDRIIEKY